MNPLLPDPLEHFIARYVDSIETLETLLLLERSRETFWMTSAIESHLGFKAGSAEKRLQLLLQNGFVVRGMSGAYRYCPKRAEDDAQVAELAAAYADRRAAVLNVLFSDNLARLRAFANAFKVTE
jgi:hypothetical protein